MLVEQSRHLATPVCEAASGDARARSTRVVAERAAARRAHIDPGREDDSGVGIPSLRTSYSGAALGPFLPWLVAAAAAAAAAAAVASRNY